VCYFHFIVARHICYYLNHELSSSSGTRNDTNNNVDENDNNLDKTNNDNSAHDRNKTATKYITQQASRVYAV